MKQKLNIGLCGYGFIGKIHAIAYQTMHITTPQTQILPVLHTLCSRSADGAEGFLNTLPSFTETATHPELDLIDICTPDALHCGQGMEAIQNEKHVYIEKPVGVTLKEIRALLAAARLKGVIGQTALVMRFLPAVVAARDLIADGALGEILNFKVKILNNSYQDPDRPVNWRMNGPLAAGGSLMDTGVHGADLIRFLLGEPDFACCETKIHYKHRYTGPEKKEKAPVTQDEWAFMRIALQNGASGELETSRIAVGLENRNFMEIYGTNGYIFLNLKANEPLTLVSRKTGRQSKDAQQERSEFARYLKTIFPSPMFDLGCMLDMHSACAMNMLLNVAAGKVLHSETPTLEEAYHSQALIAMGYLSAREGGKSVHMYEMEKEKDI